MTTLRIIAGAIALVVGAIMVIKSYRVSEIFGEQEWMIKLFGYGHASLCYKLIGIVVVIVSFLLITGLAGDVILWFFSPIFKK